MTIEAVAIDATDFNAAAQALDDKGLDELAEKTVKHALRQSANVVRDKVRTRARRHSATLARNVHTTWKGAGMAFQLRVKAEGRLAHLIAGGARPHLIDPHRPMPVGGATGFAEVVRHPGFRGDPFVHLGIRDAVPAIQAIVDAAGQQMAADLAAAMKRGQRP